MIRTRYWCLYSAKLNDDRVTGFDATSMAKAFYKDKKGRTRWVRNDEVAATIKQLGEYLIIGGYPEDHAKRYAQIAYTVSRWPDSIDELSKSEKLESLPGVGGVILGYIDEIVRTGTTSKFQDDQYGKPPPLSVLQLTEIERLGAKTARMLYQDLGIDSLSSLCQSVANGDLNKVKGVGPKMLETIGKHCKRS